MSEITQNAIYAREVQRKWDELISWIIENNPDKKNTISRECFLETRQAIFRIANGATSIKHIEPEPEAGGAQYINDNPAPWP
jgi:hypothetical protein